MTSVHFQSYLYRVAVLKTEKPHWRMGQCYWNTLESCNPRIAAGIVRGGVLDPFYDDNRIGDFLHWVYRRWDD
jgi:hypothetical protein